MNRAFCIVILLLIFLRGSVYGTMNNLDSYNFTRIDINDGLSHNQVHCIYKDSRGFMWFGTNSGLNRYDGYSFRIFRHIPSDTNSLPENRIRDIFEGPEGELWISLMETFTVFNPVSQTFSRESGLFHRNIQVPVEAISRIQRDNAGNIWLISDTRGLYCYLAGADSLIHIGIAQPGKNQVMNNAISSVAVDSEGYIWLIGFYGVLEKLDPKTLRVVFRTDFLRGMHPEWRNLRMMVDREDGLWIYSTSSDEGIVYFDLKRDRYKHFHQESRDYSVSNDIINSAVQDDDGIIWIATDHGGINLVDKTDFSVKVLLNDPEDPRSLSQNSITTLYRDNIGIIWAGTFKKGICYYHKDLYKFKLFQHRQNDPESLPFDDINAFQEDKKGNLWMGTNGDGLFYYDRKNNSYKVYKHNISDPKSLSNDVIVSMLYDSKGLLWTGTYYGGLNLFDGKYFRHFRNDPSDPSSLANDRVWEIYEDSRGMLWVGTLGGGLDLYLPVSGTFRHFTAGDGNTIHSDYILDITEDQEGDLWIGTPDGLEFYDYDKGTFTLFANDPSDTASLSHDVVSSVIVDSRGWIWAATQEGLNILDEDRKQFYRYYITDGLPDNTILSLIEDNQGTIWASTTNGICNIKVTGRKEGKVGIECMNYSEADGLQGKEFNEDVAFKTSRGEIIFGGPDGFNLFDPASLTFNMLPPPVVLTDFQLFNRSVNVGQQIHGRILLKKPIDRNGHIVLRHSEDIISIEFSALNYLHPEKNRFEYMLEGFNRQWVQASARDRKVTYTNLDPGDYIFRVRASNNDGVWNKEGISLELLVRPPLWRTRAAIVFYFLFLIAALVLLRYMILERERSKYRNEQEKLEAQRRHELDLLKIRFFTNVSHEFRTPLSLIITPLEKMLKNPGKKEDISHLRLIYRNARRLLNLVNQLLDFRRMEVQKIPLKPAYGDIVGFIHEIYQTFTDLAEKKSIEFTFNSSHKKFFTWFDHDKVEKIVFNLLSNAFKFTPEGKSITISLSIQEDLLTEDNKQGVIVLDVKDTGMGIPKESLEKIFDRFFQDNVPGGVLSQGSGIGLSLTREFVQLHEGTIEVKSKVGEGSCFTVTLPVRHEAGISEEEEHYPISELSRNNEHEKIAEQEIHTGTDRPTVLLVEDNDDFRFYLKDNLKVRYTILEAINGKKGLEVANHHLPDLIVSDVMMPEMDGFELCRRLKSNPSTSHIPVILLTARMSEHKKLEGFETGADDYITKPFSFEMLESRMSNLVLLRERIKKSFQKHFKIEPGEIAITSLDEKLLNKAMATVEKQMSNPEFSVEKLSRELGMSRVHLYKKLTALTGKTPIEFIRIMRLKRAAQLLEKSQLTIAEVAYEVGFNDPRYFSRYFKAEFGMLPSQYVNSKKSQLRPTGEN